MDPLLRRIPLLAAMLLSLGACVGAISPASPAEGAGSTITSLSSSGTSVALGAPVTLTATVSPPEAAGTVTFLDGASAIGTASLGSGAAALSTSSLAAGAHALTASYGGTSTHAASRSTPVTVTVTVTDPTPAATPTTTTLASSAATVAAGAPVTLTATVSPAAATGTVTFLDGTNVLGTSALGSGTAALSTSSLAVGAHSLTASYAGASAYAASRSTQVTVTVTPAGPDCSKVGNFSFFVASWAALKRLSGNPMGFGGNLRYPDQNDTSPGAGLKGADRICAAIADAVEPGSSSCKTWRAFLSVTADENGKQVNAIDRVGNGPWYDRNGRSFARSKADLPNQRPQNCDPVICWDFPNETGTLNHNPDGTGNVDNHDMLTGSDDQGTLLDRYATCGDWTMNTYDSRYQPMCGHPWPTPGLERTSMGNWISAIAEGGCVPGYNFDESINFPGGELGKTVGGSGGYGGFYCFAILP